MIRENIGYRARAKYKGKFVYARHIGYFCWSNYPPMPQDRDVCAFELKLVQEASVDDFGEPIEVSDVKIVAVYLRRA